MMRTAAATALVLMAACGGSSNEGVPGGGGGGQDKPFQVNASLGVDLVEHPGAAEGNGVTGLILVTKKVGDDEQPVSGATVQLNGVTLPEADPQILPGFYDPSKATISSAVPGATLTLTATKGGDSASVAFKCPDAVTLTSPTDGATVALEQVLDVRWSGSTAHSSVIFNPVVQIRDYDWDTNRYGGAPTAGPQKQGATGSSAQLTVPSSGTGFAVELLVPGDYALHSTDTGGTGICFLSRRSRLHVQ